MCPWFITKIREIGILLQCILKIPAFKAENVLLRSEKWVRLCEH